MVAISVGKTSLQSGALRYLGMLHLHAGANKKRSRMQRRGMKKVGPLWVRRLPPVHLILSEFDYDPAQGALVFKAKGYTPSLVDPLFRLPGTPAGNPTPMGYRTVHIRGRKYAMHRLVWKVVHGADPVGVIDHINGIRDDNRIENLRDVTFTENAANSLRDRWAAEMRRRRAARQAQHRVKLEKARCERHRRELNRLNRSSGLLSFGV